MYNLIVEAMLPSRENLLLMTSQLNFYWLDVNPQDSQKSPQLYCYWRRYGIVHVNLRIWLLRVRPLCHCDSRTTVLDLYSGIIGLKRSGYDVRILGVYRLQDGSLSTGLPMSSADDAYP